MPAIVICKHCREERPHHDHGLCYPCYQNYHPAPLILCERCDADWRTALAKDRSRTLGHAPRVPREGES